MKLKFIVFAMNCIASAIIACSAGTAMAAPAAESGRAAPRTTYEKDGTVYVPAEKRPGPKSVVYFTRDLSAAGLQKIYAKGNGNITGKVSVKLHTGEKNGPNILPCPWVENLIKTSIPNAAIVETNTY